MKKIIILNHGLHIAGVSRTLINFANALVKKGYDVTVKIEIDDFTLKNELDERVKTSLFFKEPHIFGLTIKGFLRFYRIWRNWLYKLPEKWQYRFVVRKKYDVEIAFNRGAAARIIAASTNKKANKLAWVHSNYMQNNNPLAGFETVEQAAAAYSKFDKVVCVSENAEDAFKQKFGDTGNTVTRYNVMDVERIKKNANEETIEKNNFTIVAVGRVCEAKNYLFLLDVAKVLKDRDIALDWWIVGDGELFDELEQYRQEKGLDNVILWGAKNNPYPYMASADLYVSTSIYEGLSTTTIEALILGKPIVVTDCAGMRNILGDSEYGVVTPIEVNAFATQVEKMVTDAEHRNLFTEKSKQRAERFNPERAFAEIEEIL